MNESAIGVCGFPATCRAWVEAEWENPETDLANDMFAVVEDATGRIAAFSETWGHEPYVEPMIIGVVDPAFERRGLGTFLIEEGARRAERFVAMAPTDQPVVLRIGALEGDAAAERVFRRTGCVRIRRFPLMRRDFGGAITAPSIPTGLELRPFVVERDSRAVYEAEIEAFEDHFGREQATFESFTHHLITNNAGLFDPDLWLVAWAGDVVAGLTLGWNDDPRFPGYGYVASVAVRRPWRGQGLGGALLTGVFARMQERGAVGVVLNVDADSPTGANRLYERVGMREEPHYETWERPIRPALPV